VNLANQILGKKEEKGEKGEDSGNFSNISNMNSTKNKILKQPSSNVNSNL